jgi:Fe-S cluster assembly protein SufD
MGPAALHEWRRRSMRRFESVGLPTTRDEEFKYTPLHALSRETFGPSYGATIGRGDLESFPLAKVDAYVLAFINGQFAPELSTEQRLPSGLFLGTMEDAWDAIPQVVEEHLGKIASLDGKLGSSNDDRFVWLNEANLSEGAVVYIPRNAVLDLPIHILHVHEADHGAMAVYPRSLIVVEEGAQATVLECFFGKRGLVFANAVTECFVGDGALLEHVRCQNEDLQSVHIGNLSVHQSTGSTYLNTNAQFGAAIGRVDVNVWIDGEHTETSLNGAYCGSGEQILDNHTRIDHAKPHCHSFEIYKGILGDRATGIFNGKIFVYEDAQKTDAKQSNQAILLSPTATINTKPQLEIFADDVKCTHGATVGQLREDALFYLRARGIPEAEAKALLVYAFVAEVFEKIGNGPVIEALESMLFTKLKGMETARSAEES